MLYDWIRDPGGWSIPSGVPEVSRMNTGMSMVCPAGTVPVPTVMMSCASCAAAGAAGSRAVRIKIAKSLFMSLLHILSQRRLAVELDGRTADAQRPGGDGRFAHAGLIAEQSQRRVDLDAQ